MQRVLTGIRDRDTTAWRSQPLYQLETTVDDLDPRVWPDLLESLRVAGAHDAWCTPALMRKGRPGHVLTVLTDPDPLATNTADAPDRVTPASGRAVVDGANATVQLPAVSWAAVRLTLA